MITLPSLRDLDQPNERRTVPRIWLAVEHAAEIAMPLYRVMCARVLASRVVDALRGRLLPWKSELVPKHAMPGAVGYALNQWEPLTAFLRDAEVPIHNNIAEQEMKRQALNRKNSRFPFQGWGNERGGETSAALSSLTSSCRRHAIDPQVYLTHLLVNLPGMPAEALGSWLPDAWRTRLAERARAAETTGVG